MNKDEDTQIPSKSVVRFIASILLLAGVIVAVASIIYFKDIGTGFAVVAIIGSISLIAASVEAIRTGKPDWILLNLIFPW